MKLNPNHILGGFAAFVLVANAVALSVIAQRPAPPESFSLNDGQDTACQDYEISKHGVTRKEIASVLRDMAVDVEDFGCANLIFTEKQGR